MNIDYFKVGNVSGGNQDWFTDWWMHLGGCGAIAAGDLCIMLAKNHGFKELVPFSTEHITRASYVDLGMKMKPYIRPRMGGVSKLSIFTDGLEKFINDRGYNVEFDTCPGELSSEEGREFLKKHLNQNMPVACLVLRHQNPAYEDIFWHWFMITGYEEKNGEMTITYHTYGGKYKIDFDSMWNTGFRKKGGLVAIDPAKVSAR